MKNSDEKFEKLRKKSQHFVTVFNTPDGKQVLEALEAEFDGTDIMAETSEKTAYNLGRRDVVVYIRQMLDYAKRNPDNA